ncbi:MAG: hypothetical protein ACRDQX_04360, partial [Pseudonocardiaceae bacterium]
TTGWAWVLVSRDTAWNGWLRYAVVATGILAVALLVAGRVLATGVFATGVPRVAGVSRAAGVLSVVALLLAPAVWSSAVAAAASGGGNAQAGPSAAGFGHARFGQPGFGHAAAPARSRGASAGGLTAGQRKILAYAQTNSGRRPITLAVAGGAMAAEAYLIHSDDVIVGMGGFSGQDPAPTVATLAQWVEQGQLRFVLVGEHGLGGTRMAGRGGVSAQRVQWVSQHCAVVDPGAYGGSAPAPAAAAESTHNTEVLYDCQAS